MNSRVRLVTLKRKKNSGNAYDQLYGGPPIIVVDIVASDEVSHIENAEKIHQLLEHLDWETKRELGKKLVSFYPADPKV